MEDQDIFDYNYELGLDREEVGEGETDSITGVARESGLSSIPAVSDFALKEYQEAKKAYEESYTGEGGVLSQIQKARDILLSQPTQKSRGEYVQGLAQSLTAPRKQTDPRFFERRNLYTFLRDVGEYGAAEEKAQKEAELKQKLELLKLDELKAKYGQEMAAKRYGLASELLQKQKAPAATKEDEIIRLQNIRAKLDISDPQQARQYNELTKRINYLGGDRPQAPGEAKLPPGIKAIDEQVGKDYGDWIMGGASAASSRITKLNRAISDLKSKTDISGPVEGFVVENMPSAASVFYPEAQNVKDVIESVVQEDLRAILGGQFAQLESKELIKRAYNPRLSEKQNLARVQLLLAQIKNVTNLRQSLFDYFAENNTTQGFDFKKLDPNKLLLTDEDTRKLDAGMSVDEVLAGKPLPKKGEKKEPAAGGAPAGGAPAGGAALTVEQKAAAEIERRKRERQAKQGG